VKVYVVFLYDYDATRNLGIFDSTEKAESFVKTLPPGAGQWNAEIQEWEVK
jgi:hypothetical protein